MSGLYQKDYLNINSSSQSGAGGFDLKNRNWVLIITILLILVAIIIDVTTHSGTSSGGQKAMLGLWASMFGLYFIFIIIIFGGKSGYEKPSKFKWVLNIIAIIFITLDLIWACVLVAISDNELSGKEKGILYGRLIVLYTALITLSVNQQFKIIRKSS